MPEWVAQLIAFLQGLFRPKPQPIPEPQPEPQPEPEPPKPPQPVDSIPFPPGTIKTNAPNSSVPIGIPWTQISRWEPWFTQATATEGRGVYGPLLLACFVVIESRGNHYTTGLTTGSRREVVLGRGDGRAIGLMQIRTDLHDPREGYKPFEPEGNIRLGAKLLADWIESEGSWEAALANKWHPGTDPVSMVTREEYIRTVRDLIKEVKASWPGTTPPKPDTGQPGLGKSYAVAGLARPIVLPFPLRQALIPAGQTRQRPGRPMVPAMYVQHDTGNRGSGANALMHKNYLQNGAEGQTLSYHLTVDDKEAWQMIPLNEVAWHGGDGAGPCNYTGISCELCINADINEPRSREYAAILAAEIMNAANLPMNQAPAPHQSCAGKYCPQDLLQDGDWASWQQRVLHLRRERRR